MAKRKRLTPAVAFGIASTGQDMLTAEQDVTGVVRNRAPIADVAGAAAATAALEDVTQELTQARQSGRMVALIGLEQIEAHHLVRDRLVLDEEEMSALIDSLRVRGQQTPAEVVELDRGRYGLISGWRRMTALQHLYAETKDARFARIQCLIRKPDTAAQAYLAMVEENEIRANLNFYERARIAARAAEQGAFPSARDAVRNLFAVASRAKRSKINSFLVVHDALDGVLRFPSALSERTGLALAKALSEDDGLPDRLHKAIHLADPQEATAEQEVLSNALRRETPPSANPQASDMPKHDRKNSTEKMTEGLTLTTRPGYIALSGPDVTPALTQAIKALALDKAKSA